MNREIKFRAWDGEQMLNDWVVFTKTPNQVVVTNLSRAGMEVMQFTGLLDKNGKEIYEGDVVVGILGNRLAVEWSEEHVGWDLNPSFNGYEVIGNIYENPELLLAQDK